jgi:hypothetical protein
MACPIPRARTKPRRTRAPRAAASCRSGRTTARASACNPATKLRSSAVTRPQARRQRCER